MARVKAVRAAAAQAAAGQHPDYQAQSQGSLATQSSSSLSHTSFQRGRVNPLLSKVQALAPKLLLAVALIVVVAFLFMPNNKLLASLPMPWKTASISEAEPLYRQGRYEDVINIVRSYRAQNQNKMPKNLIDTFSKALVQEAKLHARDKEYDQACTLLEQVPAKSSQANAARSLLKRYQGLKDSSKE